MTNEERIGLICNSFATYGGKSIDLSDFNFLIALARIGASVMPRPIEEAKGKWFDWPELYYTLNGAMLLCYAKPSAEPLCFYDLSALPKPQVTT